MSIFEWIKKMFFFLTVLMVLGTAVIFLFSLYDTYLTAYVEVQEKLEADKKLLEGTCLREDHEEIRVLCKKKRQQQRKGSVDYHARIKTASAFNLCSGDKCHQFLATAMRIYLPLGIILAIIFLGQQEDYIFQNLFTRQLRIDQSVSIVLLKADIALNSIN